MQIPPQYCRKKDRKQKRMLSKNVSKIDYPVPPSILGQRQEKTDIKNIKHQRIFAPLLTPALPKRYVWPPLIVITIIPSLLSGRKKVFIHNDAGCLHVSVSDLPGRCSNHRPSAVTNPFGKHAPPRCPVRQDKPTPDTLFATLYNRFPCTAVTRVLVRPGSPAADAHCPVSSLFLSHEP